MRQDEKERTISGRFAYLAEFMGGGSKKGNSADAELEGILSESIF